MEDEGKSDGGFCAKRFGVRGRPRPAFERSPSKNFVKLTQNRNQLVID
jgi:hypothetical protein